MFACVFALLLAAPAAAQTSGTLQGRVVDTSGGVLTAATVSARSVASGFSRSVTADDEGRYYIVGLPAGTYHVTAAANGFRSEVIQELSVDVGGSIVRNFVMQVGDGADTIVVNAEMPLLDRASASVEHVVTLDAVQELPLNGRRFTDLALLVPGTVAPSFTGFSTTPIRGVGPMAINIGGNREEAVGFLVNGISTNNLTFGSLTFQPPIASIHEFKVTTSVFSPEHGHVSGAVVSLVTRSGTDTFHGELFEFFRDDALDARNFFESTSAEPHPFRRHQFGGAAGGPIVRGRQYFFGAYESVRQRQALDLNSFVLSDEQRAAATHPTVRRLIELIPTANVIDANGAARYVGSALAVVETDRWTVDVQQHFGTGSRLHVFVGQNRVRALEPTSMGNSIPGFGHDSRSSGSIVTIGATQILGPSALNEVRLGRSALRGRTLPARTLNPATLGIQNGVSRSIGLPQIVVAGGLNFGGPANYPQGRSDASYVASNTVYVTRGAHLLKLGGEYRRFLNDNVAEGSGLFNFPTVAAFLEGTANSFSITLGERTSEVRQEAMALFVQDAVTVRPDLSIDLGLRYEVHQTPTEKYGRFVVFDAATATLQRLARPDAWIYRASRNLEPRVGVVWSPSHDGRTVVRAAYGLSADEPGTAAVRDTAANPPFATPLVATGVIPLGGALATAGPPGLIAPMTTDPGFRNATLRAWNVNLQRQIADRLAVTVGYMGSAGRNLRLSRNINQPVNGVRPYPQLSASSPILPGTPLGNVTQVESTGYSNYRALWLTSSLRRWRGLQFDLSYTWAQSLDTNSLNSSGFIIQNSYDIPAQYGPSDFDVRHRVVISAISELNLGGHPLARGWQIAATVRAQSGSPINIVTSNSTLTGTANTVRPNVTGPIRVIGSVDEWFDTSVFVAANGFGTLRRNAVVGPGFHTTDVSLSRSVRVAAGSFQFRVDAFNVFNHTNFGPPGNMVGSPMFGRITRTRLATGEAGSSRQVQVAVKLSF